MSVSLCGCVAGGHDQPAQDEPRVFPQLQQGPAAVHTEVARQPVQGSQGTQISVIQSNSKGVCIYFNEIIRTF